MIHIKNMVILNELYINLMIKTYKIQLAYLHLILNLVILVPLCSFLIYYQYNNILNGLDTLMCQLLEVTIVCFFIFYISYWLTYAIDLDFEQNQLLMRIFGIVFYRINLDILMKLTMRPLQVYPSVKTKTLIPRGTSVTEVKLYFHGEDVPKRKIWKLTLDQAKDLIARIKESNSTVEANILS